MIFTLDNLIWTVYDLQKEMAWIVHCLDWKTALKIFLCDGPDNTIKRQVFCDQEIKGEGYFNSSRPRTAKPFTYDRIIVLNDNSNSLKRTKKMPSQINYQRASDR